MQANAAWKSALLFGNLFFMIARKIKEPWRPGTQWRLLCALGILVAIASMPFSTAATLSPKTCDNKSPASHLSMPVMHEENTASASGNPCDNHNCKNSIACNHSTIDCEPACSLMDGCGTSVVLGPSVQPLRASVSRAAPTSTFSLSMSESEHPDSLLRPPIV